MNVPRLTPENLWNIVFATSLVALVSALCFLLLMPPAMPKAVYSFAKVKNFDKADFVTKTAKDGIEAKLWNLDSEELGGSVLSSLNAKAEKNHLQMSDFRIEKTIRVNGQREAPFVVVLDGDFKDVIHLVNSLELSDSKLGVGMFQLATSDRGPGFVKATLGITAFLRRVT